MLWSCMDLSRAHSLKMRCQAHNKHAPRFSVRRMLVRKRSNLYQKIIYVLKRDTIWFRWIHQITPLWMHWFLFVAFRPWLWFPITAESCKHAHMRKSSGHPHDPDLPQACMRWTCSCASCFSATNSIHQTTTMPICAHVWRARQSDACGQHVWAAAATSFELQENDGSVGDKVDICFLR